LGFEAKGESIIKRKKDQKNCRRPVKSVNSRQEKVFAGTAIPAGIY